MVIASIAFGFSLNLGYRATEVLYGIRKYASWRRSGEGGEAGWEQWNESHERKVEFPSQEEIRRLINRAVIKSDYINSFHESLKRPNIANLPSFLADPWIKLRLTRISRDGWIARQSRKSSSRETIVKAIASFVFSLLDTWLFSESLISRRWRNGARESIIFALTFRDPHMRTRNESCSLPRSLHNTLLDQFSQYSWFFLRTKVSGANVRIDSKFVKEITKLIDPIKTKSILYICMINHNNKRFAFSFRCLELIESAV